MIWIQKDIQHSWKYPIKAYQHPFALHEDAQDSTAVSQQEFAVF